MEDLHRQEEADPSETGSHHSPGPLQRTVGSKEIRCLVGEIQRREGAKEKGGRGFEEEERERKARSSKERKLVVFRTFV